MFLFYNKRFSDVLGRVWGGGGYRIETFAWNVFENEMLNIFCEFPIGGFFSVWIKKVGNHLDYSPLKHHMEVAAVSVKCSTSILKVWPFNTWW